MRTMWKDRPVRPWELSGIVIMAALAVGCSRPNHPGSQVRAGAQHQKWNDRTDLMDLPLTVSAYSGSEWSLSIDPAGKGELAIKDGLTWKKRQFQVPEHELAELKKAIVHEKALDFEESYGEYLVDITLPRGFTILFGEYGKQVSLGDFIELFNSRRKEDLARDGPPLRIWFRILRCAGPPEDFGFSRELYELVNK
jgi:hypothetical protein